VSDFPLDSATLVMLAASCEINPDTEQTHLHDFLDMGTRIKSQTDITAQVFGEEGGTPVFEVEYEEGYEPFSPQHVIRELVAEILRLRGEA
jgi:hypothetical protein